MNKTVNVLLLAVLPLAMAACLPPIDEQKNLIRKNDIQLKKLNSRAFLETWGPPAYEHREVTQFFVTEKGMYVPRFRVPLGDAPKGWNSDVASGDAYFLAYPDRGELLGFVQEEAYIFEVLGVQREKLVYREQLSAEQIHKIGKSWKDQERLKMPLEGEQIPFRK